MRATATLSSKAQLLPVFLLAGLLLSPQNRADPAVPVSECRQQSADQAGFIECMTLQLEQSEITLAAIEQGWREALRQQVDGALPDIGAQQLSSSGNSSATEKTLSDSDGSVIAIVSDEALSSGVVSGDAAVVNVDDEAAVSTDANRLPTTGHHALHLQQFEVLVTGFRQYRDQRCEWESGIRNSAGYRSDAEACTIALNHQRTIHLRDLLAEKRATDIAGEPFRGWYVQSATGASFQSCDHRVDWWVSGADEVLQLLTRRYDDITAEKREIVFVELRGEVMTAPSRGPGADFVAGIEVVSVNLVRPILEWDCSAIKDIEVLPDIITETGFESDTASNDESVSVANSTLEVLTVDDLGDAGFLYGYFNSWMSACAVDQLTVCKSQTQVNFSTEEDWLLSIDRSSIGEWRVWLVPTTNDHTVGRLLKVDIDGVEVRVIKVADSQFDVNRGMVIASDAQARALIAQMRTGGSLDISWIRSDLAGARLSFSLLGITRALEYFDQTNK